MLLPLMPLSWQPRDCGALGILLRDDVVNRFTSDGRWLANCIAYKHSLHARKYIEKVSKRHLRIPQDYPSADTVWMVTKNNH